MGLGRSLRLLLLVPLAGLGAAMLGGCTNVPELDAAVSDWAHDADYPKLIPLTGDLAAAPATGEEAEALQSQLESRAARLQARARSLQGLVVDDAARARMRRGVTR